MKSPILGLIDFGKVDRLLEGFNKSTGFVTAILDINGVVLSKSGWRQICTEFHRVHPETSKRCTISDTELVGKLAAGEKYIFYKCLNGLIDAAVPIVVNGEHIANLFTGQFFFEEPDEAFFTKQAEVYGFNKKRYMAALRQVPVVSKEKVIEVMEFLLDMTELISEITYNRLEQTELNNALAESETQFRNLANAGSVLIWTSGTDKLCNFFNEPWLRFTGRTHEQEVGYGWTEGLHPDDFDRCVATYVTAFDKREAFEMEYSLRNADGKYRIIFDLGTPNYNSKGDFIGYIGYCFDVTERKQIESELWKREDRLSKIMTAANDGMWDWNLLTNQVYFDPRYYQMSGYETDEFPHELEEFRTRIHPDDTDYVMGEADKHLKGEIDRFNVKFRFRMKSGDWQWIEGKGVIVEWDKKGIPLRFIGTHRDITELKQAEEKINKINEQLEKRVIERTSELEASNKELEAFSYSVSHDLRAPLRHINGFVNLLKERFHDDLPDLAQHYLTTITDASRQMGTLIDDLLEFSRVGRQRLCRVKVDMNDIIKAAIEEVSPVNTERDVRWSVMELPQLSGDSSMLKLVWTNLLDNAVKYTRNTNPAEISVGFKAENNHYEFYVRDNGVGFNMKYAHKLFGVFQRLHSHAEFEGTGIGLANVQRIIHKHNGRVWAEAESGKGAAFFFSLPINKGEYHD